MAGSVNKVILLGNLGLDPEVRHTQNGRAVANLRLATNEAWTNRATGERHEHTEWHRVTVFKEQTVRFIENYVRKGSRIFVEGQIRTRKWQDREGNDRYSTEVVVQSFQHQLLLLDSRGGGSRGGYDESHNGNGGDSGFDGGYDRSSRRGQDQGGRRGHDYGDVDDDDNVPF